MRSGLLLIGIFAASLGGAACRDREPGAAPSGAGTVGAASDAGPPPAPSVAEAQACLAALADDAVPRGRRLGAATAACRPCGPMSLAPLIDLDGWKPGDPAPDRVALVALIDACGGFCTPQARSELSADLADLATTETPSRPWRNLAEACPGQLTIAARFASGRWFVLDTIARWLDRAPPLPTTTTAGQPSDPRRTIALPLPPRSAAGTVPELPEAGALVDPLDFVEITVAADLTMVGVLPWARLAPSGAALLDGEPLAPGKPVALDQLGAALRAAPAPDPAYRLESLPRGALLLAPRGVPAARVLAVVGALDGSPATLAARPRPPASFDPLLVAGIARWMTSTVPAEVALLVGLAGDRFVLGVVDAKHQVIAATTLPAATTSRSEQLRVAVAKVAEGQDVAALPVVVAVDGAATVADLAELLDGLATWQPGGVAVAPATVAIARLPAAPTGADPLAAIHDALARARRK